MNHESEAAWIAEEEYASKRNDRITQSSNATTARLPKGTVAMSSIAATSGQRPDGGSLVRKEGKPTTTVGRPMPDKYLLNFRLLSIFLGTMGLFGHITTSIFLIHDINAFDHAPRALLGKSLGTLSTIPVRIDDLSLKMTRPLGIEIAFVFPGLVMPILAIVQLSLSILLALATGQDERLPAAKYLLIFIGVSIASRLFIGLFSRILFSSQI